MRWSNPVPRDAGVIKVEVDLKINDSASGVKLDRIISLLASISKRIDIMAGELDALTAKVARNGEVIDSAVVLIRGIKTALDAAIASGDPAKLTALSDTLDAKSTELANAVAENTPAAP